MKNEGTSKKLGNLCRRAPRRGYCHARNNRAPQPHLQMHQIITRVLLRVIGLMTAALTLTACPSGTISFDTYTGTTAANNLYFATTTNVTTAGTAYTINLITNATDTTLTGQSVIINFIASDGKGHTYTSAITAPSTGTATLSIPASSITVSGSYLISAYAANYASAQGNLTVNPGNMAKLNAASVSFNVNSCIAETFVFEDSFGNAVIPGNYSTTTASVTGGSSAKFYSDSLCTSSASTFSTANSSSFTVYVQDEVSETFSQSFSAPSSLANGAASLIPVSMTAAGSTSITLGGQSQINNLMPVAEEYFSTDAGTTWTMSTASNFPAVQNGNAIVYDNAIFHIGGQSVNSATSSVFISTDGLTWNAGSSLPDARFEGIPFVFQNKLYYLGGLSANAVTQSVIYQFTPGAGNNLVAGTWSTIGAFPVPISEAAVFNNGTALFIAGGYGTNGAMSTVRTSTNVTTWTTTTSNGNFGPLYGMGYAFLNGTMYMEGGFGSNGSAVNSIYSSTTGQSWTAFSSSYCSAVGNFPVLISVSNGVYSLLGLGGETTTSFYSDVCKITPSAPTFPAGTALVTGYGGFAGVQFTPPAALK